MSPLISIIVPNYNHGRFLPARLDSILHQTLQDWELLILDDCSTDNSIEIISNCCAIDERITALFNEKNSGSTFKQWELGIANTSGRYIWIAESDDYADTSFLEKLVPQLEANPDLSLAYCQSWITDEESRVLYSNVSWTDDLDSARWRKDFINNGINELAEYFVVKNTIPNASAVIFRRAVYEKFGAADFGMKLAGDKMFWTHILLNGDIYYCAEPLNYYRTHSQCVRNNSNSFETLNENIQWFKYLKSHVKIKRNNRNIVINRLIQWLANEYNFSFIKVLLSKDCSRLARQITIVYPFILARTILKHYIREYLNILKADHG